MEAHMEKRVKEKHGKRKGFKTKISDIESIQEATKKSHESQVEDSKLEFEIDKFSDQLKLDGTATFEALRRFLECCHDHEEDSASPDPVSLYLQVSPQCTELMNLLDMEKRPAGEIKQIFEVITQIILSITDGLVHYGSTVVHIINRLLRAQIRHVLRALNFSNTSKIIMSALKLLTAMVTHSTATAKEVLALYNIGHDGLAILINRTDSKAPEDVRICALRFLMAFLITDDKHIVEQLLTHTELMKSIFKEIHADRMSTLHLILPTIQQYVVCNPLVSKTQKIKLLNEYTLRLVATLYNWQGRNDMQDNDGDDGGKSTVRQLVHRFLLEVTCNRKQGINFYDKTMGTSGRSHNAILLKFSLTLKTANEDPLVQELVVNIFQTCPDILVAYFNKCSLSFAPRNSKVWRANMALVMKVYSSLPVNSIVSNLRDNYSTSKMVSMAMVATVPTVMKQAMIIQGLKQVTNVGYTLLEFIQSVLSQSQKITEAFMRSCPDKPEFVTAYHVAIQKALPNIGIVLPVWNRVLLKWKEEQTAAHSKQAGSETIKQDDASIPTNLQTLGTLMEVLCSYQQVIPSCYEQTSHDFSLMILSVFGPGKMGSHGDKKTEVEEKQGLDLLRLQCRCLKFLMGFPAGRFRWFKEIKGEGTTMHRLLTELTSTNQPELQTHLAQLVNKLLIETGLFEHTPQEVSIWLDHLMTLDPSDKQEVVTFLQGCLTGAIRNPYPYNDRVADSVASGQASRQQHLHGDQAVVKSFSIEDIPEVSDLSIDPSAQPECSKLSELDDLKILWPDPALPCSALLPVALDKFTESVPTEPPESVARYITNVSTTILHQQVDPLPFCLLLQQYDGNQEGKAAGAIWEDMLKYSGSWLHIKATETPKKSSSILLPKMLLTKLGEATTFSASLQACYDTGHKMLLHDEIMGQLKAKITVLEAAQIPLATRHVLLYLHTLLDMQTQVNVNTLMNLVCKYITLIHTIVDHAIKMEAKQHSPKLDNTDYADMRSSSNVIDWDCLAVIILKHPLCLYWFQQVATRGSGGPAKDPGQVREISMIVIGHVLEFVTKFSIYISPACLQDVVAPYARSTFLDLQTAVDAHLALSSLDLMRVSKCDARTEEADSDPEISFKTNNVKSDLLKSGDQDTSKDQIMVDIDEKANMRSSLDSEDSFDTDHFDQFAPDLKVFLLLSAYADKDDISNVILSTLEHPDLLLQEASDADGVRTTVLTYLGRVICSLSIECLQNRDFKTGALFGGLLQSANCEDFGKVLLRMMLCSNKHVLFTTNQMLFDFLDKPTPVRAKVSAELIKQSFAHRCHFESWCLKKQGQSSLAKNKEMLLPVLRAYWESRRDSSTTEEGVSTVNLLWDIYWPWLSNWFTDQTHCQLTDGTPRRMSISFSCILSMPKTTAELVTSLLQRLLMQCLGKNEPLSSIQIGGLSTISGRHKDDGIQTLVLALQLRQITALTNNQGSYNIENILTECHHHWRRTTCTVRMSSCPELPRIWKDFVRQVLKSEYERYLIHELLASLVSLLYVDSDDAQKLIPLEKMYQMIVSHSKFLPTMLAVVNEEDMCTDTDITNIKGSLVRLMLAIASLEPSCCQTAHFAVMLGAYSASMLYSDCHLLALMRVYEKNNAVMWKFRPYMWGLVAITQHAARKALGLDLWQQPNMREVLELLDPAKLHRSALNFPLDRELHKTYNDWNYQATKSCYDPCFLLPLFSHLLAPESVADCKKFAECHAMEFTLAALGSYDPSVRSSAYHILTSFHQHIKGEKLMGKREVMYLLECLRNSITEPNYRLPNVVALFIGRMTTVMMSPAQHIYPVLVQFLTIKPTIQLDTVPMFYRLFHSTNLKHGIDREWMLQLLLDGLRDAEDYQVYEKTGVFKTLLAFQLSVLCADTLNTQIFELLKKACAISEAAHQFIRQHSLLTWIGAHITIESNISSLGHIITLLHILSKSVLTPSNPGNSEVHDGIDQRSSSVTNVNSCGTTVGPGVREGRCKLPVGSAELFFSICVRLLDHLNPVSAMKPLLLREYLETLCAVFQYHDISTAALNLEFQNANRCLPLGACHVLQLLLLYATVLKKTDMLRELAFISPTDTKQANKTIGKPNKQGRNKYTTANMDEDTDILRGRLYPEVLSHALLSVVTHWRPSTGDSDEENEHKQKSSTKEEKMGRNTECDRKKHRTQFVLLVMKWVLATVSNVVNMTVDHWRGSVSFVKNIIYDSADIQEVLINDVGYGKDIKHLLLAVTAGDGYTECMRQQDVCYRAVENDVNQIFLRLVSRLEGQSAVASSGEGEPGLARAVMTMYKKPLEMCRQLADGDLSVDETVSSQLTALLMQELWIGSEEPHHFLSAWDHCIGSKGKKKKKRKATKEDVDTRTPKKKKHIKGK